MPVTLLCLKRNKSFNLLFSILLFVCCGFPKLLCINNICIVQLLADPVIMPRICGPGRASSGCSEMCSSDSRDKA